VPSGSISVTEVHAEAPGRVNLIGEHTDYQDGFVLPCAVPQRTCATLQIRSDRHVRAWSAQMGPDCCEYDLGEERRTGGWGDYLQGITWVMGREGIGFRGFELHLHSTVPVGSGLSSSAALEIATLRVMRTAFDLSLSDLALARAAQRAEVEFVGAPVGIMDQMACSFAGEREALFLDTRTLEFERIPLPDGLDLVVIDSGVAHQHAGGDYIVRQRESAQAAERLGVARLRDIGIEGLPRLGGLPATLARRARHIITENQRVRQARAALLHGDLETLGALFRDSHASLRDDYEVSVPAVDLLVELAGAHPKVFGARMTGGGFGGAVVIAAASGSGPEVAAEVRAAYGGRSGREAAILVPPGM
jgi:galactokinase